jgi:Flp pilus assembly protein TadD
MTLDPRDGAPLGNLETLLRESGRLEEAAVCRSLAEKVRKKDPYFHAFLAEDALGDGDLEEAERRARMALRLQPREADFHLLLARIKLAEGDLEGAGKGIQDAKELANPLDRERYDWKLAYVQGLQGSGAKR